MFNKYDKTNLYTQLKAKKKNQILITFSTMLIKNDMPIIVMPWAIEKLKSSVREFLQIFFRALNFLKIKFSFRYKDNFLRKTNTMPDRNSVLINLRKRIP